MSVVVTTDGSCVQGQLTDEAGRVSHLTRGPGGWAAIVVRDGVEVEMFGSESRTTSTRMELRAVIEGLRSIEVGSSVVVRTDVTIVSQVIGAVRERRFDLRAARASSGDRDLWFELRDQVERLGLAAVRVVLVRRRDLDLTHRRCHKTAKREAKALMLATGFLPSPRARSAPSSGGLFPGPDGFPIPDEQRARLASRRAKS